MRSEWRMFSIAELTINHDARRIPVKESDRRPGEYPYYGASGVVDYVDQYIFDGEYLLVAEDGENLRSRKTPVAFMATGKFWVNNHAHILQGNECADTRFLSYLLESTEISGYLTGSTIPKLSQGNLNAIEVSVPSVDEQKAIAHILGTLDDKIELNRKTNETLEAMAKALFKSWFVDFDPVRAKAEGRPTGLPAEISDLFPDSFEDSELGGIPSGWGVRPLSDIFSIQGGSQPPAKTFVDMPGNGYVRLLQIRDFIGDNHLTFVPESKNLRIAGEDDILIGRYGSGSGKFMDDSLGRPLRGLSGAINVAIVKALPRQNNMIELIYCMVLSGWFYRQIVGGSSRAVQAGFRKEDLDLIPFPMPPNSILDAFQEMGSKIWHRTKALDVQTKSLCQIRDSLLPKLISGEIRIPDAEKMLEEVGV